MSKTASTIIIYGIISYLIKLLFFLKHLLRQTSYPERRRIIPKEKMALICFLYRKMG